MTKTHASKRKVDLPGLPHKKRHLHDLRPKNQVEVAGNPVGYHAHHPTIWAEKLEKTPDSTGFIIVYYDIPYRNYPRKLT